MLKTVISTQVNQDYSEWFLGHSDRSSYWAMKEAERKEIYLEKIMKYLTFLDYTILKNSNRSIEAKLEEKEKEIADLQKELRENKDAHIQTDNLRDKTILAMTAEIEKLRRDFDQWRNTKK